MKNLPLVLITWGSVLIPIILFLTQRGKKTGALVLVFLLCVCSFITDAICFILGKKGMPNLWVIDYYLFAEVTLVLSVFAVHWKKSYLYAFVGAAVVAAMLITFTPALRSRLTEAGLNTNTIFAVLITLVAIWSLMRSIRVPTSGSMTRDYFFWLTMGFIFYFFGNLFIFMLKETILIPSARASGNRFWAIHNVIHTIYNFILGAAFIIWKKHSSAPPLSPASR